ncbi:MAG: hypothetical protein WCJ30_12115 [Deltaproteobacteria bacterium]
MRTLRARVALLAAVTTLAVTGCVRPTSQSSEGARRAADGGASAPSSSEALPREQSGSAAVMPAGAHPLRREGLARFGTACCVRIAGCTRAACPPPHRLVGVTADGGMTAPVVRRIMGLNGGTLDPCWWGVLARGGAGPATVSVSFTLDDQGHASGIDAQTSPTRNADLEACVTEVMQRWEYPRGTPGTTRAVAALTF